MKAKLTNITKSSESGFRLHGNDREVDFETLPTIGERFLCSGEGLEFGTRLISTSPVTRFLGSRLCFETETGSIYELTLNPQR